jgi:hypothetical protein
MADGDLMIVDPTESPSPYVRAGVIRSGSTPVETFRGVMQGRTPDGGTATVIVTRQGLGPDARVWLTFGGAIQTTVVMTKGDTGVLRELLDKATLSVFS